MKFTDDIKTAILLYLIGDGPTPQGHACRFFTVGDIGVKVYDNGTKAREAYINQEKAASLGFGPAVGEQWNLRIRAGAHKTVWLYGYLTEVAETNVISEEEEDALRAKLKANGWATYDTYGRNTGRLKDGRAVCIDFDPVSMGQQTS